MNTPEEILARLIEAFEVVAATGKGDGPRNVLSTWPDPEMVRNVRRRRQYSPLEISRTEEAMTWWPLIEDVEARRALQFEVMCQAGAGKFSQVCEKYGWKRTTVISRNRVVLKKLSEKLCLGSGLRQSGMVADFDKTGLKQAS